MRHHLPVTLQFISCSLLATYVPADDHLVKAARVEPLSLWVPGQCADTARVAFQGRDYSATILLQFQHCDHS